MFGFTHIYDLTSCLYVIYIEWFNKIWHIFNKLWCVSYKVVMHITLFIKLWCVLPLSHKNLKTFTYISFKKCHYVASCSQKCKSFRGLTFHNILYQNLVNILACLDLKNQTGLIFLFPIKSFYSIKMLI